MRYPREFFAIQLEFAQKMTELTQGSYQDTILHNTAFYRILGLDWSFDANNPVWQAYCEGLQGEKEDVEWTYQFYLSHLDDIPEYDTSMQHWAALRTNITPINSVSVCTLLLLWIDRAMVP